MLNNYSLLKAFSYLDEGDIEQAAESMGYCEIHTKIHHKNIWKTALIAAIIACLLSVAAFAVGYWGRKNRTQMLPPDNAGHEQQVVIPNGFTESATFKGSLEWWTYQSEAEKISTAYDYTDNEEEYSIAKLYMADSREKLDELLRIADKYKLKLYKTEVRIENKDEFEAITGLADFSGAENLNGYIFEDGSFKIDFEFEGNRSYPCTMTRIRSGSIYPYGGVGTAQPVDEVEYKTKKGQDVSIGKSGGAGVISYVSSDGETFIEINFTSYSLGGIDALKSMKRIADSIDFEVLCRPVEILPEDKTDGRKILNGFNDSTVYRAACEFNVFFSENFRNPCFTGTYGMEGCADIDMELVRLAAEYSIIFSRNLTTGNEFYPQACCYDNGSWYAEISGPENTRLKLHYIPKNALYTGLSNFTPFDSYAYIRDYKASDGSTVVLVSGGPDKLGIPFALYESDSAYAVLYMSAAADAEMEKAADSINWAALK